MAEILARLDRATGLKVFCGSVGNTCRGELARVRVIDRMIAFEDRTLMPGDRVLCMLDGWREQPRGHWALSSKQSIQRAAKATAAVRKGDMAVDQLALWRRPRWRHPVPVEHDANRLAYGLRSDNSAVFPGPEGIKATCPLPECGRVNTLTAERLRVASG